MSPFDFINAITYGKTDLISDNDSEKEYTPFMVNRGLSYFMDTVLLANEMNRYHQIDNKMQFDFLRFTVRKRKRFSKWHKHDISEIIKAIQEIFNYSEEKARTAYSVMNEQQLAALLDMTNKGGVEKRGKKKNEH
jgi:alpha-galactosidase/6-phospho-beta-glucosidase family protein